MTTAVLFPVLQFFNSTGTAPLAGGSIVTYTTGTTTPLATYLDSTGTAAPAIVPLDSGGRPNSGQGMWLNLTSAYDLIVYSGANGTGTTVLTITNYAPTASGLAPNNASYVTVSAESALSAERVLTGTAGQIVITDAGANSTVTLTIPSQITLASHASAGSIALLEASANGTNKVTVKAPDNLASDFISTLPSVTGNLLSSGNNLSDVTAATARTNLGVGTGDSPQFTGIELGNASDTTLTRSSGGNMAIEGNLVYRAGGTDVPVTDGGTGVSTLNVAYSVLCAGTTATGAVQNTASAGSSGQPLISGGASALPSYGTLTVGGGGTGVSTLTTAYGTVCAGTTATGALQTVSPGSSGNALISGGASALPAYGNLGIGGGGTGQTTALAAYDALAPTTTQGDITYRGSSSSARLAAGTKYQFLQTLGSGANPAFGSGAFVLSTGTGSSLTQFAPLFTGLTLPASTTIIKYILYLHVSLETSSGTDTLYLQADLAGGTTWDTSVSHNYYGYQGTTPTIFNGGSTTGTGLIVHPLYGVTNDNVEATVEIGFYNSQIRSGGQAYNNSSTTTWQMSGISRDIAVVGGSSLSLRLASGTSNTTIENYYYSLVAIPRF